MAEATRIPTLTRATVLPLVADTNRMPVGTSSRDWAFSKLAVSLASLHWMYTFTFILLLTHSLILPLTFGFCFRDNGNIIRFTYFRGSNIWLLDFLLYLNCFPIVVVNKLQPFIFHFKVCYLSNTVTMRWNKFFVSLFWFLQFTLHFRNFPGLSTSFLISLIVFPDPAAESTTYSASSSLAAGVFLSSFDLFTCCFSSFFTLLKY